MTSMRTMVARCRRLARRMARRHGVDEGDLLGPALLQLVLALERYRPGPMPPWRFVRPRVYGAMQDELRRIRGTRTAHLHPRPWPRWEPPGPEAAARAREWSEHLSDEEMATLARVLEPCRSPVHGVSASQVSRRRSTLRESLRRALT